MTNLELAICEAENAGEIDLDTRNELLFVLTEGTNIEIMKHKLQTKELLKTSMRKIKRYIRTGNPKALRQIDTAIKSMEFSINDINKKYDSGRSKTAAISSYKRYIRKLESLKEGLQGNNTNNQVDASFESERKSMAKRMQNDLFMYLKKYVSEKEFKDKYKDFLHLINIKKDNLSYFNTSVEITEWQDGIDSDALLQWEKEHEDEIKGLDDETVWKMNPHTKNKWYDELLSEGCRYLETKYKDEMKKYRIGVDYGDGDEGHIYIIDEEKE